MSQFWVPAIHAALSACLVAELGEELLHQPDAVGDGSRAEVDRFLGGVQRPAGFWAITGAQARACLMEPAAASRRT
jgi:hypothetical protein